MASGCSFFQMYKEQGFCESDKAFETQHEECSVLLQWLPMIYLENIKGAILLAVQNV